MNRRITTLFILLVVIISSFIAPGQVSAGIGCGTFYYQSDYDAVANVLDPASLSLGELTRSGCEDQYGSTRLSDAEPDSMTSLLPPSGVIHQIPEPFDDFTYEGYFNGSLTVMDEGFSSNGIKHLSLEGIAMPGIVGFAGGQGIDEQCYGQEADDYLTELLNPFDQEQVWFEPIDLDDDDSSRSGYLWVENASGDFVMINHLLVREGMAVVATSPLDARYVADLRAAQERAIADGAGLWGAC